MAKLGTTPVRLRNQLLSDLKDLLDEAGNTTSTTAMAESILAEAIAQMKAEKAPARRLPTIDTIRAQTGRATPALVEDIDLATRVLRVEEELRHIRETGEPPPLKPVRYSDKRRPA
jgi:hypothetical protein